MTYRMLSLRLLSASEADTWRHLMNKEFKSKIWGKSQEIAENGQKKRNFSLKGAVNAQMRPRFFQLDE